MSCPDQNNQPAQITLKAACEWSGHLDNVFIYEYRFVCSTENMCNSKLCLLLKNRNFAHNLMILALSDHLFAAPCMQLWSWLRETAEAIFAFYRHEETRSLFHVEAGLPPRSCHWLPLLTHAKMFDSFFIMSIILRYFLQIFLMELKVWEELSRLVKVRPKWLRPREVPY